MNVNKWTYALHKIGQTCIEIGSISGPSRLAAPVLQAAWQRGLEISESIISTRRSTTRSKSTGHQVVCGSREGEVLIGTRKQ